ncbi:class I SAM-dependent methyltransferase [Mucilaginibacter sp. UYCu711]|uniref:class I SAM-dependent methyltransferase n=1 Tax=Mucilaginibacter sp. UYCu711 TaxID=3156339 RepID=UPI003D214CAC
MIKQISKKLFKEFIYIKNSLYILSHQLSKDNKIFTHLTIEEKITLHKTVKNIQKTRIVCVEIGSYLGASSCFIANALNNNSVLYCIDTWENDAMIYSKNDDDDSNLIKKNTFEVFLSNTKNYISKIKMLRGWSYLVVVDLKTLENNIDFIFIDGDHNYDGVKKDWDAYKPLLKKGSLIVLHDTSWATGVNQVIKENILPIATIVYTLPNLMVLRVND